MKSYSTLLLSPFKKGFPRLVSAMGVLTLVLGTGMSPAQSGTARDVTFIHTSDTQPDVEITQKLILGAIAEMNKLPGTPYPKEMGGKVDRPRGVIITGDLTDDSSQEQWDVFVKDWGLTGKDGIIKYPLYEGAGNHDGAVSKSPESIVRRAIIARNKDRVGIKNVSKNGLHYSFDWDDVHFVCLNEYGGLEKNERYPGNPEYGRKRQSYGNPAEKSLQFLRADLAANVGSSGRPVILYQHYGIDDFVFHPWGNEAAWWTETQAMRLWDSIEGYNVIALLGGHNGSETTFDWFGIVNQHMDDHVKFGVYHINGDKIQMAVRDSETQKWLAHWSRPADLNSSLPPGLLQGPYLVKGKEKGSMTICWRMKTNKTCTLKWGTDYFKFKGGSAEVKPFNEDYHLFQHSVEGLKPGSSVKYTLEIDGKYAPGFFFTPEAEGKKVKFLITDAPESAEARANLFKTMYAEIYEDPAYHSFIIDTASITSSLQDIKGWDNQLFSRGKSARHMRYMLARSPMIMPTGGNGGAQMLFPYDYQKSGAYSVDYPPVHIAMLEVESGLNQGSEQKKWLVNDLKASSAPCKMIVWRRSGDRAKDRAFENELKPVCKSSGVDFVLNNGSNFEHEEHDGTTFLSTSGRASKIGTLIAVTVEDGKVSCQRIGEKGIPNEEFQWNLRD